MKKKYSDISSIVEQPEVIDVTEEPAEMEPISENDDVNVITEDVSEFEEEVLVSDEEYSEEYEEKPSYKSEIPEISFSEEKTSKLGIDIEMLAGLTAEIEQNYNTYNTDKPYVSLEDNDDSIYMLEDL